MQTLKMLLDHLGRYVLINYVLTNHEQGFA
jgi:hypothetical protein